MNAKLWNGKYEPLTQKTIKQAEKYYGIKLAKGYFNQLTAAEAYGKEQIEFAYHSAIQDANGNYKAMAELIESLCWKYGQWYAYEKEDYMKLYRELFLKTRDAYLEMADQKEQDYYYSIRK